MTTYIYKARDGAGKSIRGTMEAHSRDELTQKLHHLGYMTTQVAEKQSGIEIDVLFDSFHRISTEDLVAFNVQLANLIHAGVSLLSSLETLHKQIENKRFRDIVGDVVRSVESGESFSEALAKHPRLFPKVFISMIKAGEASGKLDTILTRFAAYSENQAELKQKIQGALFYPAILLAAGIAVILFIVTTIIPQFVQIFVNAGIHLPLPTYFLYQMGLGLKQFWLSFILFVAIGWLGISYYGATVGGRFQLDKICLRLPLFGPLIRKAAISRFSRTLGMLAESGVPILQSLDIVKDVIGNEILARIIQNTRSAIEKGEKISETLKVSEEFPPDVIRMISVGEETGNLDEMLNKISDFYDRSVDYSVKKLTTLIEPILLIVMGSLIGFIMASLLLPMFDMVKFLRHSHTGF